MPTWEEKKSLLNEGWPLPLLNCVSATNQMLWFLHNQLNMLLHLSFGVLMNVQQQDAYCICCHVSES